MSWPNNSLPFLEKLSRPHKNLSQKVYDGTINWKLPKCLAFIEWKINGVFIQTAVRMNKVQLDPIWIINLMNRMLKEARHQRMKTIWLPLHKDQRQVHYGVSHQDGGTLWVVTSTGHRLVSGVSVMFCFLICCHYA